MERLHPIVNFTYFAAILGFAMVLKHPVCLVIGFVAAFLYVAVLFGVRESARGLCGMLGVMLLTAILNPAFSHQGVTFLWYFPSGNVLTLESIYYGMAAAGMLGATLMWFRCAGQILTTDKILFLLGRPFPAIAVILSMALSFLPKMSEKMREIRLAQNDRFGTSGGRIQALRRGVHNISCLITWALADAVEIADSMRGRGYGLPGRRAFSVFRFTGRDGRALCGVVATAGYVMIGVLRGGLLWNYYPETGGVGAEPYSLSLYVAYGLLCLYPALLEKWEDDRFRSASYRAENA